MKASVLILTYNHESFIEQSLDSVLMQKINYDHEIVIGEDCSTDRTPEIVKDYARRFPGKIRLLLHEKNVGGHVNFSRTRNVCKGEYIALLEGDDYWTSPCKLQKQVDFLDGHADFTVCFHNATVFYDDESQESRNYRPEGQKEVSTIEDILRGNFIPTCAVMFRNGLFHEFPDWYYKLKIGDWPLHILNSRHGKIGYINEVMAAHRIHADGVWAVQRENRILQLEEIIRVYEYVNAELDFDYDDLISSVLVRRYRELAKEYEKSGELD